MQKMICDISAMKIGYGTDRHVSDFAPAKLDTFTAPGDRPEPRVWMDTDKRLRPELTQMLFGLNGDDIVYVLSMSDLGAGREQALNAAKITATGAAIKVVESNEPTPPPRKPGPKSKWPDISADVVNEAAEKWRDPNRYTWWAALDVLHKAGHTWVKRHNMTDNLGPRNVQQEEGD